MTLFAKCISNISMVINTTLGDNCVPSIKLTLRGNVRICVGLDVRGLPGFVLLQQSRNPCVGVAYHDLIGAPGTFVNHSVSLSSQNSGHTIGQLLTFSLNFEFVRN